MPREPRIPDRPIFVIGPHRSGTTALYMLLARHPETAFLNRVAKHLPGWPWLAAHARSFGLRDQALEAQRIWDRWPGRDDDVRAAADAPQEVIDWYRRLVSGTVASRGVERFVAKYPRLSLRIPWLEAVFPGALYVHLVRDWRAVVRSAAARHRKRVGRERSWFGVHQPGWRLLAGRPVEEIATHQYVATVREIAREASTLGDRYVPVCYEALCADAVGVMRGLTERLGLGWTAGFQRAVVNRPFRNCNAKWRDELDAETIGRLCSIAPDVLLPTEESDALEHAPAEPDRPSLEGSVSPGV